jgi:SET domain-containing protein
MLTGHSGTIQNYSDNNDYVNIQAVQMSMRGDCCVHAMHLTMS